MAPILDVNNASNWLHIYNHTLYAAVIPTTPPRYTPIPVHKIPLILDRRTLAVGSSSTLAKPTWRLGFFLIGSVQIPGIGLADVTSLPIFFGLNLVRLPNLHDQFVLKARIPKWQQEMEMSIWKYIGVESDS